MTDYNDDDDTDGDDNNEDQTALQAMLRKAMEDATDPIAAMAHRFEYHIFHAGKVHRIGRAAHEDIIEMIGEWCVLNRNEIIKQAKAPIHVFMDGVLWMALEFKVYELGRIEFQETSVMFGLIQDAIVEEDFRVFEWRE